MSRLPIRVRLTAAFAAAMVVVLAGAALFIYVRVRADLDEALNTSLSARADAVAGAGDPAAAAGDPEEAFAAVRRADGSLVPGVTEREVPGVEGTARVLVRPLGGDRVVVVGQSLDDRDETLAGLLAAFAVGGPIAVLLASLLGYALATAALRPVEAMRARAAAVSLDDDDADLPLPDAHDEIRRLGETLNEMLARLRRSFERERRFVADAGHELRTPIAVVKTELETLLRRGDHPPEVREALLGAAAEADHLALLADDLLVLARSAEGRLSLRPERLDAAALLDGARERFVSRAAAEGRRIDVDVLHGVTVDADPLRIRQALGNLVDNALRHGTGPVSLSARATGGGTEIDVADTGPGFDAAFAERAFERFARGDEARRRGGAGLGLAIVRAVADAHGGRAEIVPGSATVRLWLPTSQVQLSPGPHGVGVHDLKGTR